MKAETKSLICLSVQSVVAGLALSRMIYLEMYVSATLVVIFLGLFLMYGNARGRAVIEHLRKIQETRPWHACDGDHWISTTVDIPRTPGSYLFRHIEDDELYVVLYVGLNTHVDRGNYIVNHFSEWMPVPPRTIREKFNK